MVVWAKRSIALVVLAIFGGSGLGQTRADWGGDADPAPQFVPAAFTTEAERPPVGGSVVNRPAAPQATPSQQAAPIRSARDLVAPPRRPARPQPVYSPIRQPRVAQNPPEVVEAAPAEPAPIEAVEESQLPADQTDSWDDHLMANGPDAIVYSSSEWMNDGCWFFDADLVLMNRANPKTRVLTRDTTSPLADFLSPAPGIITSSSNFRIAPGMRLTFGHWVGRDWANRDQNVEFSYMGLFDWDKNDGVQSSFPQRLYTPFDPGFLFVPEALAPGGVPIRNATFGGFAAADTQEYEYTTTLNSAEMNVRSRYRLGRDAMTAMPDGTWSRQLDPGPTPSLMAGLRYIRINETFNWHSQRFNNPALGQANLGNATGDYDIETSNDLFGFQFGGDWMRQDRDWRFGGWIKLGGLVNFASQRSTVIIDDNFFSGDVNSFREAEDQAFTFMGEAGLEGAYHMNPNVSLRAGLQLLWIQSIAVATDQIDFDFVSQPSVDLAGNIFYMGASVGLEVIW